MVEPAGRLRFRFIGISVMGLTVNLGRAEGLAIGGAVLIKTDIAVSFLKLFL